jgi:hypothetical protein
MDVLLPLLVLVLTGVLIVGLIKPSIVKQPSRKRVGLIFGGGMVAVLVIGSIISPSKSNESAPAPVAVANTPSAPATPQTLEQRIAGYAPKDYGSGITFKSIEEDSGSKLVTLNVTNIVGPSTFKSHTATLAAHIFQDTFKEYPKATGVSVIISGNKTDKYGNTANGTLMSYFISKDVFAKINWSNFSTLGLCDFLRNEGSGDADMNNGCAIFASDLR